MGYYLQMGIRNTEPLALNKGWGDVIRWSKSLPEGASALYHLCHYGWTDDVKDCIAQLETYLESDPPASADTEKTVQNMLTLLRQHKRVKVVSVTNGLG